MTSIDAEASVPTISAPVEADFAGDSRASKLAWATAVAVSCLLAALVVTWPLALNLTTAVPRGTEREATVQLFNAWTLWWNADRVAHGYAGYWDAPIFHPFPGAFTFSEPQPLTGLAVAPLWALGAPPALIYNLALLAMLMLNGVFAYRLASALQIPRLPALLGGVLAVALPFIGNMSGVLHLVPVFGMLWTLEGLVRFGRSGELRDASWAAIGFVATYLTSQQYALMFAPFAVAAALVALAQQRFGLRSSLGLLSQGLAAGALVALLTWPVLSLHSELGFVRSVQDVGKLSARLGDFLSRPGTALAPFPPANGEDTAGLFPGLMLLALAAMGLVSGLRDGVRGRWAAYLGLSALAAALLAMGLNINIFGFQPFELFRMLMPGYAELRSPYRFAAIMQMVLPVLAAVVLADYAGRYARRGVWAALALAVLASAENLLVPAPLSQVPATPRTEWSAWVRSQPDVGVLAHVPFPGGTRVAEYEIEALRMFAQMDHGKPIVNGYSGFFPPRTQGSPGYTDFQLDMAQLFPQKDLLCALNKGLEVDTLVVDKSWLAGHKSDMEAQAKFLTPAYEDDEVQIYRLQAPEGECVANETAP